MKLSKSKVNTYLKCPKEFEFQYINKIEMPPNKYMALGSDVHLIAETFADKFGDELCEVNIQKELDTIAYDDLDMGYDLSMHIDNLSSFFTHVFIDKDYRLFSTEEYLYDKKNNFSGICDIILENDDDNLVVIDYKTSNSNSFSRYRLELCYYKMLVENVYKRKVDSVGVFFTKNGRLRLLDIKDDDNKRKYLSYSELDDSLTTLDEVRCKINDKIFPKNHQYTCRFCTYRHLCEDPFYNFR